MSTKRQSEFIRWYREVEPDRLDLPEAELHRRAGFLFIATVLAVGLCFLAIGALLKSTFAPPRIVAVTSDGWTLSGKPVRFRATADMDNALFDEVYEKSWLRTEQGGLDKALAPFVGNGIIDQLAGLNSERIAHKEAFRISAVILERREAAPRAPDFVSLMYRTRLNIRILRGDDNASSVVFFNAVFKKFEPTFENPLGWKMVEFRRILPEHFYADEAKARQADVFKSTPR